MKSVRTESGKSGNQETFTDVFMYFGLGLRRVQQQRAYCTDSLTAAAAIHFQIFFLGGIYHKIDCISMASLTIEQCLRLALERRTAVLENLLQVHTGFSTSSSPVKFITQWQTESGNTELLVQMDRLQSICTHLRKQVPAVFSFLRPPPRPQPPGPSPSPPKLN